MGALLPVTYRLIGGPLDGKQIEVDEGKCGHPHPLINVDYWLLKVAIQQELIEGLFPRSRGVINRRRVALYRKSKTVGDCYVFEEGSND